MITTEECD